MHMGHSVYTRRCRRRRRGTSKRMTGMCVDCGHDCRTFFALSFLLHCHSVLHARPNCVELWTNTRYITVTAKCSYYRRC